MRKGLHLTIIAATMAFGLLWSNGCSAESEQSDQHKIPNSPLSGLARADSTLAAMHRFMWDKRDSLSDEYADTFEMKVEEVLRDPATFDYPFDSLKKENLNIVESDDRKLRVIWWGTPWSGTWHQFPTMLQSRPTLNRYVVQNGRVFCEGQEGCFPDVAYHAIYNVEDSLYIAIGGGQFMGKMPFEIALGYVLSDTGVSDKVELFPSSKSREHLSSLYVDKLWYLNHIESSMPSVMVYHPEFQMLSYPELIDTASGKIVSNDVWGVNTVRPSGDTIRLHFNGRFFELMSGK